MSVVVRPPAVADHAAWLQLWQGYLTFYKAEAEPAVTEHTWRRLLHSDSGIHGLVAQDGEGRVVGLAHYLWHPSTWSAN